MMYDRLLLGQGKITSLISEMFNTNYDYFGTVLSNLAKVSNCIMLSLVYPVPSHVSPL